MNVRTDGNDEVRLFIFSQRIVCLLFHLLPHIEAFGLGKIPECYYKI